MTIPRPAQVLSNHITVFLSECAANTKESICLKPSAKSAKMSKKHPPDSTKNDRPTRATTKN